MPGLLRAGCPDCSGRKGVKRHAPRLAARQRGILAFMPLTVVGPGRLLVAGEAARVRPGDEVASSIARRCRSRSPPARRLMNAPLVEWIGMGGRIIKPKVKSSIIFTVGVLLDGERKPLGRRPAQAGTHNPHTMLFSSAVPQRCAAAYGSPEFTNEVQHLLREVLPWGASTSSCHWTTDARLPGFKPMDKRSSKSLQLWIARHRPSLAR